MKIQILKKAVSSKKKFMGCDVMVDDPALVSSKQ